MWRVTANIHKSCKSEAIFPCLLKYIDDCDMIANIINSLAPTLRNENLFFLCSASDHIPAYNC